MDSSSSIPSTQTKATQSPETLPTLQPTHKDTHFESHFPTASANQLLELIDQGHDPANLNGLINHTQLKDRAA